MSDITSLTETVDIKPNASSNNKVNNTEPDESNQSGEKNYTDPKVCHDPSIELEGIVRMYAGQHKTHYEDGELTDDNKYDSLKIDGIEYPLVIINNRNVENHDIISMQIFYDSFLPTIIIKIYDEHESEQKINTTQMSGMIRVLMISPIDKIYKKILLNFRILSATVNPNNRKIISYFGEYYVAGFRDVNTMHIAMDNVCSKSDNCHQGGHINANTWEMLHKISELTGLGFAATKNCKDVKDHIVRHICGQRFNNYIEEQLSYSGTDVENILDAWVDLYGYIVLVNVPWVLNENVGTNDLSITANVGIHPTSNDLPEQKPKDVVRALTNYNLLGTNSNLEIESYNINVNNNSIQIGTLERIYPISMTKNGRLTVIDKLDIQTKQNSIDGEFIEDYNTGKKRPIPKFDFNEDSWTGLSGGYNINTQKRIRNAYFNKLRQSLLNVKLKTINFGLQRGTLVNIEIFDNDIVNKDFMMRNGSRIARTDKDLHEDKIDLPEGFNEDNVIRNNTLYLPNIKLSGLYYIDGMKFEYYPEVGKIDQTLILIKKGETSGYTNKHSVIGLPKYGELSEATTTTKNIGAEPIVEQNIV